MYDLIDWYLGDAGKDTVAWGLCNNHPNLPTGIAIHTSAVAKVRKESDGFVFVTKSGSEYFAAFQDIDPSKLANEKKLAKKLGISEKELGECVEARRRVEDQPEFQLKRILGPTDIYIEINANSPVKAYAMYEEGDIHQVKCEIEMGMFEDSAVITDGSKIDFRFTMKGFADINPVSWSDYVRQIKFHNKGDQAIFKSAKYGDIALPKGEITIIDISDYKEIEADGEDEGTSVLTRDE